MADDKVCNLVACRGAVLPGLCTFAAGEDAGSQGRLTTTCVSPQIWIYIDDLGVISLPLAICGSAPVCRARLPPLAAHSSQRRRALCCLRHYMGVLSV